MKKTLFTFLLACCIMTAFGQSFQGEIVYQMSFKSKVPNMTDQQFAQMMGTVQHYFIKDGNYKSEVNGSFLQWQLFVNADNKLYNKVSNSEAILWNDAAVNPDEVLSTEVHQNAETVLGYLCDELVLTCKTGVQKYYFSSKVSADSKLYSKHLYGNWYAVLSKTNALPLKMIIDDAQCTITSVATKVNAEKLDDQMFKLPAGVKTAKSPY